jgi:hypothetical protein
VMQGIGITGNDVRWVAAALTVFCRLEHGQQLAVLQF